MSFCYFKSYIFVISIPYSSVRHYTGTQRSSFWISSTFWVIHNEGCFFFLLLPRRASAILWHFHCIKSQKYKTNKYQQTTHSYLPNMSAWQHWCLAGSGRLARQIMTTVTASYLSDTSQVGKLFVCQTPH